MFFNRKNYDWSVATSSFPDETNKDLTYQTRYFIFKNIYYFGINCSSLKIDLVIAKNYALIEG